MSKRAQLRINICCDRRGVLETVNTQRGAAIKRAKYTRRRKLVETIYKFHRVVVETPDVKVVEFRR